MERSVLVVGMQTEKPVCRASLLRTTEGRERGVAHAVQETEPHCVRPCVCGPAFRPALLWSPLTLTPHLSRTHCSCRGKATLTSS